MKVSTDNFVRAESDLYFGNLVADGGLGRFTHFRELTPLDRQLVVRQNRDTLYSAAVFDLDAGPVTVVMPDSGKPVHVGAGHHRGSLRAGGRLRTGTPDAGP